MSDLVLENQGEPSGLSANETAIYPDTATGKLYKKKGSDTPIQLEPELPPQAIALSFSSDKKIFSLIKATSYTVYAYLEYAGTDTMGQSSDINLVWSAKDDAISCDFRIYDITNANTIAESTANIITVAEVFEMLSLGALSNLSTGPAIWELQTKADSAGAGEEIWISAFSLK